MRDEFVTRILSMLDSLQEDQKRLVQKALIKCLSDYDITPRQTVIVSAESFVPKYVGIFLAKKLLSGRAEGTVKLYKSYIMDFFLNKPAPIEEMDTTLMLRYLFDLQQRRGICNYTLESVRCMLNTFFEWAQSEGYIKHNFVKSIDVIKYTEKPRNPLTTDEVEMLRDACQTDREKVIIDLLLSSGIRISELLKLRWNDIDFQNKTMMVLGKGLKYRTVCFDSKAKISLMRYKLSRIGNSEYVVSSTKKPYDNIKKGAVNRIIKTISNRSGINKNITAHVLRHTFATHAIARGMSLEKVKELLGHESCDTTLIYTKIAKDQIQHEYQMAFGS